MNTIHEENSVTRQERLIVCLLMLLTAFLITSRCSLNPYVSIRPYTDSSVYLYIAKLMRSGGVMYRDTFDHKGPLLYIINYVGMLFGTVYGVWIFELLSFFVTGWFAYRIMRSNSWPAFAAIGAIISLLLLSRFFDGGNNPEEYALPFTVCSMYIFYEHFRFGKISSKRLFACGLCWMAVMLIRPNMIALWVVFALAVLVKEIREKTFRLLFFLGWFLLGAACLLMPIVLYLAINGALIDFWNDYILFNLTYTQAEGTYWFAFCLYNMRQLPVALSILVCLVTLITDKEERETAIIHLLYIGLTLVMISMSGRGYRHYGITLMPIYVLPLAFIMRFIAKHNWNRTASFVVCCAAAAWLLVPWVQSIRELSYCQRADQSPEYILSCLIADYTEPTDMIVSCGNADIFYVYSDRMAASKYSYQLPIAEADPSIYNTFMTQISVNPPEVIVTSTNSVGGILYLDRINEQMDSFIKNNHYTHWITLEGFSLFGRKPLELQETE